MPDYVLCLKVRRTTTAVPLQAFQQGDVYIDYPFEDVMFRYEHQTHKVFRKFYGEAEVEVPHSSRLFGDATSGGRQVSEEEYAAA